MEQHPAPERQVAPADVTDDVTENSDVTDVTDAGGTDAFVATPGAPLAEPVDVIETAQVEVLPSEEQPTTDDGQTVVIARQPRLTAPIESDDAAVVAAALPVDDAGIAGRNGTAAGAGAAPVSTSVSTPVAAVRPGPLPAAEAAQPVTRPRGAVAAGGTAAGTPPTPGAAHAAPHLAFGTRAPRGDSTLTFDANTAAGASYLLWWVSGLLVYFNERQNRFVRFHAVQAILLTCVLTVFSVLAYVSAAIFGDLALMTGIPIYSTLSVATAWLAAFIVLFVWLWAMIAAWTGHDLSIPVIGRYAARYSVPVGPAPHRSPLA